MSKVIFLLKYIIIKDFLMNKKILSTPYFTYVAPTQAAKSSLVCSLCKVAALLDSGIKTCLIETAVPKLHSAVTIVR